MLKFGSLHLYSDAMVALRWIVCSEIPHSIRYISIRTQTARTLIQKHGIKLHYIEMQLNPADLLTKELDKVYYNIPLWITVPSCIRERDYPIFKEINFETEIGNHENFIYTNAVV